MRLLLVCALGLALTGFAVGVRSVHSSVSLRLVLAGTRPLFMRSRDWDGREDLCLQVAEAMRRPEESALSIGYKVSVEIAADEVVQKLDSVLARMVQSASSGGLDGPEAADGFAEALALEKVGDGPYFVDVLLYSPVRVPGRAAFQYGYTAGRSGTVDVLGMSRTRRFMFVDASARPFMFDGAEGPALGELLLAVSREQKPYAFELGRALREALAPPASTAMRRFPVESSVDFRLSTVDASAVLGRPVGVSGGQSSTGDPLVGAQFDAERFKALVGDVLGAEGLSKVVSVGVTPLKTSTVVVALAVTRAFRMRGQLHLILDPQVLLRDLVVRSDGTDYHAYSDMSFVMHIPMFLFSFADSARLVHFGDDERIHAKTIGGEAIVVMENRLRNGPENHEDITALAATEALELLCGLDTSVIARFVDVERTPLPLLVKDLARFNVLDQKLTWSRETAVEPAEAAIGFDGFDLSRRGAPMLRESRRATQTLLASTLTGWDAAAASLDAQGLEDISLRLTSSAEVLRERVGDEVCSQTWTGELELEVEAAAESRTGASALGEHSFGTFFWRHVLLPLFLGTLTSCAFTAHSRKRRRREDASFSLSPRVFPSNAWRTSTGESSSSPWFSTLTQRHKNNSIKLN